MRTPVLARVLALSLAFLSQGAGARAQDDGAVHLRTGFIPDPAVLEGQSGASRPATELAAHCAGFVGAQPSHLLALETRFGYLRLFATSEIDLVLAVRTAAGEWLCSDDRFGPHPAVEGLFAPGRVEVWVGAETLGQSAPYALRITETRSIRPGVGNETSWDEGSALARDLGLEIEAPEGTHESIRLDRGFLPDPRHLEGVASGTIDASSLGGTCRGRIDARPTHVLTLRTPFDFLQLYLDAEGNAEQELSLVVLTPDKHFLCDLGNRQVPHVEMNEWAEGVYRVWVGVPQEGATLRHRLGISEIRRVR